jgi:cell division cycle 20-like protein 1 (cofactor of APC complex)
MAGLKNSPFGKRLRALHQGTDDDAPKRNRPRINPIFGLPSGTSSTPSLDSRPTTSESSGGPESPIERPRFGRDYGDRFVPSRDAGDMRTSYHLMEECGPSTPSKNRIIPTESDALKGKKLIFFIQYHP